VTKGFISGSEARWLLGWLERIAPAALTSVQIRLTHGDMQTTNIMVRLSSREYAAIIDWGRVAWGDPAWDFAGMPLRAVPYLLEGYRQISPMEGDATAEARTLWRHLQIALWLARRTPEPGVSWAEQPLPMLLEIMRFFLANPQGIWDELRPIDPPAAG